MTNFRQQIELNRTFYPSSAALALIMLAFIWGYNWVVMKKVLAYCGPFDFAAAKHNLGSGGLMQQSCFTLTQ